MLLRSGTPIHLILLLCFAALFQGVFAADETYGANNPSLFRYSRGVAWDWIEENYRLAVVDTSDRDAVKQFQEFRETQRRKGRYYVSWEQVFPKQADGSPKKPRQDSIRGYMDGLVEPYVFASQNPNPDSEYAQIMKPILKAKGEPYILKDPANKQYLRVMPRPKPSRQVGRQGGTKKQYESSSDDSSSDDSSSDDSSSDDSDRDYDSRRRQRKFREKPRGRDPRPQPVNEAAHEFAAKYSYDSARGVHMAEIHPGRFLENYAGKSPPPAVETKPKSHISHGSIKDRTGKAQEKSRGRKGNRGDSRNRYKGHR